MGQLYVPLDFTASAGTLDVSAPADANLAPPGYYMLFIVNDQGVPSIAPFVRLAAGSGPASVPALSVFGLALLILAVAWASRRALAQGRC